MDSRSTVVEATESRAFRTAETFERAAVRQWRYPINRRLDVVKSLTDGISYRISCDLRHGAEAVDENSDSGRENVRASFVELLGPTFSL